LTLRSSFIHYLLLRPEVPRTTRRQKLKVTYGESDWRLNDLGLIEELDVGKIEMSVVQKTKSARGMQFDRKAPELLCQLLISLTVVKFKTP
jgi:hypothetical protein